jgi:hypothetical protein
MLELRRLGEEIEELLAILDDDVFVLHGPPALHRAQQA